MSVLRVQSLHKKFINKPWFGSPQIFNAVNGVSFNINHGEIVGLLGPNGAGKTTTIQMLLGTLTPTSGIINYFGKDFASNRSEILTHVTFASAYVKLPSKLTIQENLEVFARLYNVPPKEREARIKKFLTMFDMWHIRHKYTGELSAGQMTRVMLAKAFIPHPKIVLLDEPTASLDPDIAQEVRSFVLEQKKQEGLAVLFTSHNMDEVTQVCDRVLVLQQGTIIADNSPAQLAASVSNTRVNLTIMEGMDYAQEYVQHHNLAHTKTDRELIIDVDEKDIATLLNGFAHKGITYSQISIDKPTLEEYFMSIASAQRKQK
ncbi:N/A [soil metagenome]